MAKIRLRIHHSQVRMRNIALMSVSLMIILDIILQDSAGYLNAWFLILETIDSVFGTQLLDDSHKYIFFQDNLGAPALPFTWFLFILFHYLLAVVIKSSYDIGHSFYMSIKHTLEDIIDSDLPVETEEASDH